MNDLMQWAARNGIPHQALNELVNILDCQVTSTPTNDPENIVQQRVEMEVTKAGGRVWRNNVGACVDQNGNFIRYGLCNKSKQQNKRLKSSDLIGITPVKIDQSMIGLTAGIFTAIECKRGNWVWRGDEHETAQLRYINLVKSLGGFGWFENGSGLD